MNEKNQSPKLISIDSMSKKLLFEILEHIGTGVLIIDEELHKIVYANKEIERISGYKSEEMIGKVCNFFLCPSEAGRCPITDLGQYVDQSERSLINRDGKEVPVIKTVERIKIENKEYFIETVIDNTNYKLGQQAIEEIQRRDSVILAHLQGIAYRCNYDRDWTMQFISDGCYELTGYKSNSLLYNKDLSYNNIITPEYRDFLWNEWARIIKEKEVFRYEYPIITASGKEKWVYEQGQPIYGENGEVVCLEGLVIDINDRKIAEEKLKETNTKIQQLLETVKQSEERFRVAQEMSPDGFTILHPVRNERGEVIDFTWVYENPAIARVNHTDPLEVIGKRLLDVFPEHRGTVIFEAYIHTANTRETQIFEEINVGDIISGEKWLRLLVVPMSEDIVIIAQDITKRKKAESELIRLRFHDHLTGLYNRSYYEEIITVLDNEENLPISVVIGDINGLRLINNAYGNEAGDKLIAETAQIIRRCIREDDILARTGGDDFTILMPRTNMDTANGMMQ